MEHVGEIHGETDLTADARAGFVFADDEAEGDSQTVAEIDGSACHRLELRAAEAIGVGDTCVDFAADGEAGIDVVEDGQAGRVDLPSRGVDADNPCAGVAGEKDAEVEIESGLGCDRLLNNEIEPVVDEAGAELIVRIAGGEFDVEAGTENWSMGIFDGAAEIPFDAEVGVARASGGWSARVASD